MLSFLAGLSPVVLHSSLLVLGVLDVLFLGWLFFLGIRFHKLRTEMKTFLSGKDGKDLEKVLVDQLTEVRALDQEIQELFEISNRLRELVLKSLHKTSVVRFNPFKEVGGNQSFSVALLDGKNSGVVLSSLHTREGTRVYAKPVVSGKQTQFPFTEEEKTAIEQAISGKPKTTV
jgi:hypothetical protein